jgi:MFS family permease
MPRSWRALSCSTERFTPSALAFPTKRWQIVCLSRLISWSQHAQPPSDGHCGRQIAQKFSQPVALERDAPALTSRATFGATIGNMLEFYDFITYSFFAIQIGRTFFPSHGQFASLMLSLATFGAGFITRPLGALVIGAYSDRVGRRPAMILSFAMMGAAIIALALTPSYNSIGIAAPILVIVARLVQGFSLGGEVGPTTAYLMEAAAVGRRGLAVSLQFASQRIAATAGALVGVVLSEVMTSEALDSMAVGSRTELGVGRSWSGHSLPRFC